MSVYKNAKLNKKHELSCGICGSKRSHVVVYPDDYGDHTWIQVSCKRCGAILFYNGA